MNVSLRGRHAPAGLVADLDGRPVVLLEYETQWGRAFSQSLMSWGVDVFFGPEALGADDAALVVVPEHGLGSRVVRDRLRLARHLLPEADLLIVSDAGQPIGDSSNSVMWPGDLAACLRASGVDFHCEVRA